MTLINFNSEHLYVDGISFNIQNLNINIDPNKIALNLSKHFNSYILLNDRSIILFHDPKKKYKWWPIIPLSLINGYRIYEKHSFSN